MYLYLYTVIDRVTASAEGMKKLAVLSRYVFSRTVIFIHIAVGAVTQVRPVVAENAAWTADHSELRASDVVDDLHFNGPLTTHLGRGTVRNLQGVHTKGSNFSRVKFTVLAQKCGRTMAKN